MNIISGSTNNIFYTKGYNFDDKVSIDPESGLLHLDHALTQLMILRVAYDEGKDMDDRYETK